MFLLILFIFFAFLKAACKPPTGTKTLKHKARYDKKFGMTEGALSFFLFFLYHPLTIKTLSPPDDTQKVGRILEAADR